MKQTGMNLMERVGRHAGSWPRMLTALMILAVWCGCGKDDATGPVGSGGNREVLLGIDKGVKNIRVAAGDNWSAFVSPDSKWVWIDGPDSGQKEGRITVGYKANGVFPRMAALVNPLGGNPGHDFPETIRENTCARICVEKSRSCRDRGA